MVKNNLKILAIDDNPDNLAALKALVADAFPEATVFTSPAGTGGSEWDRLEKEQLSMLVAERTRELERQSMELKHAKEALRESRAQHRMILHAAMDGFWISDMQGRLLEVNESYCRMSGYSSQELTAMSISDLEVVETEDDITAHIHKVEVQGEERFESCHRRKDGGVFDVEVSVHHIPIHDGRLLVYLRDITQRKKADQALKASEREKSELLEKLNEAQHMAMIGSWEWNLHTNNVWWSDETYRIFGVTPQHFIPGYESTAGFIHPDDLARYRELFKHSLKTGEPLEIELRLVLDDGLIKHTYGKGKVVYDNSGQPVRFVGTIMDITDRKKTEESLRQSEVWHRTLVETIPDMVWLKDMNGVYLSCNRTFERYFGAKGADIIGRTDYDFKDKDLADFFREHDKKAIAAGGPSVNEERLNFPDNGYSGLFETVKTPMRDAEGRLVGVLGIARDITERKRAEDVLRESEEKFRKAFLISPDSININRLRDGMYISINQGFTEITGYTEADVIGKTSLELQIWENPADRDRLLEGLKKDGAVSNLEARFRRKDGGLKYGLMSASIIDLDGIPHILSITRDITERKRAEDALRESEERLRVALDATRIAIWDWNIRQDIWYASPQYYTMLGYEPETGPSDRTVWLERVHPKDRELVASRIRQVLDGQHVHYGYEARMLHADGSYKWHRVLGNVIHRDEHGNATRMLGVRMDITDSKRAEEEREKMQSQLNQALKMESVGRLAGGVAHDFNNMLGIILGHTEMAMDQVDPVQPLYDDLAEIRKAAERSADLTRQLLAFARKQTVAPMVLDLNETVESMLKMLRRLIGEHIDLAWLPGTGVWPVKVDPTQIDQILANLCLNARDAISGVGRVSIETENVVFDEAYCAENVDVVPGGYILLAVSDDGYGMDKETLGKLFEPFFTTKEIGKGTGLGLATVYGIVKQNNGFIKVYSEPDQGTTFKIYFPRYRGKSGQMQKEFAAEPVATGIETILLVEDEPAILRMTIKMLERLGYNVLAANTPGAAIRLAEAHPAGIHLLMTDVVMPEMNGRDLAKNLLYLYPHLKRLFMSGYTADVIAHHGVLDEGVHFIQKPFTMKDLADMLREVLDSQ